MGLSGGTAVDAGFIITAILLQETPEDERRADETLTRLAEGFVKSAGPIARLTLLEHAGGIS